MDEKFIDAAQLFIEKPSAETGFVVVLNSKPFILKQVSSWKHGNISPLQKIQELMSEMFLILMEDFNAEKIQQPIGILAYLSLRLRRLTRPYKDKTMSFGLSSDFEDLGRTNFNSSKIRTVNEIVKIVRETLANEQKEKTALLEFMFIHMFPELAWASRLIAKKFSICPNKQREADKKRHQNFNKKLRLQLKNIGSSDWQEILDWSYGERSHLAWKIIQISPADIGDSSNKLITDLESIREKISPKEEQDISYVNVASLTLDRLKQNYDCVPQNEHNLSEDVATYGEEIDVINMLLSPTHKAQRKIVKNDVSDYSSQQNIDEIFEKASSDIKFWLEKLFKQTQVNKEKTREKKC